MKLNEIVRTANIKEKATMGVPGYRVHENAYQIWDGNQWIGSYRPDQDGNMVEVNLIVELLSAPIIKTGGGK